MATLTSAGAVSLTASTNWSPAQVPANGDILIIGAHTLTLNADIELVDLRLTSTTARLAYSGGPRTISITGEILLSSAISATAITLTTGQSLTFRFLPGSTGIRATTNQTQYIVTLTGGTLELICHDGTDPDPDRDLVNPAVGNALRLFSSTNSGSTITTVGRLSTGVGNAAHLLANASGGAWTHTHSGLLEFLSTNTSARIASVTGAVAVTINWTGDVQNSNPVNSTGIFIWSNSSATVNFNGNCKSIVAHGGGAIHYVSAGIVNYTGNLAHAAGSNSLTFWQAGGTFNWTAQSTVVAADETFVMIASAGSFNISGLLVDNNNKWVGVLYGSATGSSVGAVITNAPGAHSCINLLEPTIVTTPDPAPVLPSEGQVLSGVEYGYAASLLTGTGALIDQTAFVTAVKDALFDVASAANKLSVDVSGQVVASNMRGTDGALLATSYTTPPSASANAAQVRTELSTELGIISTNLNVANSDILAQLVDILSLVEGIAVAGVAIYRGAVSSTLVTGVLSSGTFEDTSDANETYHTHTDSAGTLEVIYDYELGEGATAVELLFTGRLSDPNDSVLVQAYDWVGLAWDTRLTLAGTGGVTDTNRAAKLLLRHTGTGVDDGKVRIRFYAASGLTTATLYIDQLLVAKSVLLENLSTEVNTLLQRVTGIIRTKSEDDTADENLVIELRDKEVIALATVLSGTTTLLTVSTFTAELLLDNYLQDCLMVITDITNGNEQVRWIDAHVSDLDSGFMTITPDAALTFTPAAGDTIKVYRSARVSGGDAAAVRTELTPELNLITLNLDAKVSEAGGGAGGTTIEEIERVGGMLDTLKSKFDGINKVIEWIRQ